MGIVASGQWLVASEGNAQAEFSCSSSPLTTSHQPLATRRVPRRAITLIEVLISMFVLLIGLLGIGAMIPAGRYEIMQGVKTDYATTVGRAAFRDLKARGFLDPRNWRNSTNNVVDPTTPGSAWALDPLGLGSGFLGTFPTGGTLMRIYPLASFYSGTPNTALADPIFRCSDDLIITPATTGGRDAPPVQQMFTNAGTPLRRSSEGNYSWLATVVPDPTMPALASKLVVSVAVFYKRNLSTAGAGERTTTVTFPVPGVWTNEVTLDNPGVAVRPGQWIMLAGTIAPNNYFRWYRVVAADTVDPSNNRQNVTLAGTDWNPNTTGTTAWLFDGVIAVYEKNMRLEIE